MGTHEPVKIVPGTSKTAFLGRGCMKGRLPGERPLHPLPAHRPGARPSATTSLWDESRCRGQAGFLFLVSL